MMSFIAMNNPRLRRSIRSARRAAFTLIELMVVMGIIAVLATMTALGYRSVAKDAKLASGKNTVMAVLDNARALAMKNNKIVLVVFRPRLDGREQYVEAVLAEWTRQSQPFVVSFSGGPGRAVADRFVPIPRTEARRLPPGVQIAAPFYADGQDDVWITLSHLPNINSSGQGEAPGAQIAVMYSPNGATLVSNPISETSRIWVDFNNDSEHDWGGDPINYNVNTSQGDLAARYEHRLPDDECYVTIAPFLAVFDDEEARSLYDISAWNFVNQGNSAYSQRREDYTEYITNNVDRIHFNRYSGVAMK